MNVIHRIDDLRSLIATWRHNHQRIALVPTMGNLHAGHLALVKKAQELAQRVIVSIFVNPLQFGPTEDFARYPRTTEADLQQLKNLATDAVFMPEVAEIYPDGGMPVTRVIVPGLSDDLCGITRPQLFYGVTTVVSKLFNIVQADVAIFGEKDFQQLVILKQMVKDLNFAIEIISHPIVREANGLAMSSRNGYLNTEERAIAPRMYGILCGIRNQINSGARDFSTLIGTATQKLKQAGFDPIDYVAIRNKNTLQPAEDNSDPSDYIILAAAFLGKTRLIDNVGLAT